jgi:phosphoglycerate transport regulatory protein PgtC
MVKKMRKRILTLIAVTILFVVAAFPLVPIQEAQATPEEIVVITPHWSGITDVAKEDFTAWYKAKTGKDVVLTFEYKDTVTSLALIREAGGEPAKVKWDVWWGGGLDAFKLAKDDGLLAPFSLPGDPEWEDIDNNIPDSFSGLPLKDTKDYTWWGAALSGFGIVYNKKYLESYGLPTPNDWTDLADPVYKGHIIACPPSKSGSNLMIIQILLQYYGWEEGWALVTKMGANIAEYTEKSHHVAPYIGKGEYGIAPIIDQYGFGQAAVYPEDVVFFYPPADLAKKSTVINPDSVAIVKGKGDTNPVALEFMKWCLGKEGQKMLFMDPINRLSVRPDVYAEAPPGYFNPFVTELTLSSYNDTLGTLRLDIVNDLFDMFLVAPKDDLVSAWKAYSSAEEYIIKKKGEGIDNLIAPPISLPKSDAKLAEAYAAFTSLPITGAKVEAVSPVYLDKREEYKVEWLDFAVKKYSDAVKLSDEAKLECEKERNEIRTAYLEALHSEAIDALEAQIQDLEADIETLSSEVEASKAAATSNLYYGLAGGLIVGLIVGALIVYMALRKRLA